MATNGINRTCIFFTDEQRRQHADEQNPRYNHNVKLHLKRCDECKRFFETYRAARQLPPIDFKTGKVMEESRA